MVSPSRCIDVASGPWDDAPAPTTPGRQIPSFALGEGESGIALQRQGRRPTFTTNEPCLRRSDWQWFSRGKSGTEAARAWRTAPDQDPVTPQPGCANHAATSGQRRRTAVTSPSRRRQEWGRHAQHVRPTLHRDGRQVTRLLIVDDHVAVRQGLQQMFATVSGIEVVGVAADGCQAVSQADQLRPDVVLMDIEMPNVDGVEATRRITATHPTSRVVILTASARPEPHPGRAAGRRRQLRAQTRRSGPGGARSPGRRSRGNPTHPGDVSGPGESPAGLGLLDQRLLVRSAAAAVLRCCTAPLYETGRAGLRWADTGSELGGRYWDRTSDLLGVNEALSR